MQLRKYLDFGTVYVLFLLSLAAYVNFKSLVYDEYIKPNSFRSSACHQIYNEENPGFNTPQPIFAELRCEFFDDELVTRYSEYRVHGATKEAALYNERLSNVLSSLQYLRLEDNQYQPVSSEFMGALTFYLGKNTEEHRRANSIFKLNPKVKTVYDYCSVTRNYGAEEPQLLCSHETTVDNKPRTYIHRYDRKTLISRNDRWILSKMVNPVVYAELYVDDSDESTPFKSVLHRIEPSHPDTEKQAFERLVSLYRKMTQE